MFQNIVSVDKEEHVITISENLNAVLDEVGRSVPLVWGLRTVVQASFRGFPRHGCLTCARHPQLRSTREMAAGCGA